MLVVAEAYGLDLLVPEGDTIIGASLRQHGEFARPEVDLLSKYLDRLGPQSSYIDVGANLGAIALPVAKRHANTKVVAIEAHRGLSGLLSANALNNRLYNVDVINAAAGAVPGLTRFPAPALSRTINFGGIGMHLNTKVKTEAVRMCTLDEIIPSSPCVIKIDVEGFELEVLKGGEKTLAALNSVWLIESNSAASDHGAATKTMMIEAGYQLFWFFAPFVTASARGESISSNGLAGDFNFLALSPGLENFWDLPPIIDAAAPKPTSLSSFGFLHQYN